MSKKYSAAEGPETPRVAPRRGTSPLLAVQLRRRWSLKTTTFQKSGSLAGRLEAAAPPRQMGRGGCVGSSNGFEGVDRPDARFD